MEPRDVIPPVDLAPQEREHVLRPEPVIEPRWLDETATTQHIWILTRANEQFQPIRFRHGIII